jgi:hypothetical protein
VRIALEHDRRSDRRYDAFCRRVGSLEMTARFMWQIAGWRSVECLPAIGCCIDLVERICASALLAFATVASHELPLPQSVAALAFTGVNFAELKSKRWASNAPAAKEFQEKQIHWLRKRLRDTLYAVLKLGLLDPKAESHGHSRPLASTPWGLILFERVSILYLGVLCVAPVSQLPSYDLERLVVKPLRTLSRQCASSNWPQGASPAARFNRFGAGVAAFDADKAKLPSVLHRLLRSR